MVSALGGGGMTPCRDEDKQVFPHRYTCSECGIIVGPTGVHARGGSAEVEALKRIERLLEGIEWALRRIASDVETIRLRE